MSVKKNFIYNILFILSNILFPIISFSYTSRIIGPEGIGKTQFAITLAQYFVIIAALGIPVYGVREVAKAKGDFARLGKLVSELLVINMITSFILLIFYFILIFFIGWFSKDLSIYIIGGLLVLFGFTTLDWFYVGTEQFRFLSTRYLIIKILALVALFAFVRKPTDLIIFFIITILSVLANNFWNIIYLNRQVKIYFKNLSLIKHIPVLLTLFSTSIAISIYTSFDTIILGFLADKLAVGYYTAAIKITKIAIPCTLR